MKLEIRNVSKTISGLKVLDNINLEFSQGLNILMGRAGAGKTTLIKILSGNLKTDDGKIFIDSKEIDPKNIIDKISYIPASFSAYNNFTVLKTLQYIASLKAINDKEFKTQINTIMEITGLTRFTNVKTKNLSQGLKVKIAIAQALLNNPKIILLDEPTRSLDIDERIIISELIQKIIQDRIVIVSNHIASDFAHLPAKVIFMKNGTVIFQGMQEELFRQYEARSFNETQEKEFTKIYMRTLGIYHFQNSKTKLNNESNSENKTDTNIHENIIPKNSHLQNYGDFSFDKRNYIAAYKKLPIDLTPVEFLILLNLLQNTGLTISAEDLFISACGTKFYKGGERSVAVHIARIRKKLSKLDKSLGASLKNIRGKGYLFKFNA